MAGIDPARPIVTLHVRESGYKEVLGIVDREKDSVRNADVDSYATATDWLIERGYQVVRFGDPQMKPFRRRPSQTTIRSRSAFAGPGPSASCRSTAADFAGW